MDKPAAQNDRIVRESGVTAPRAEQIMRSEALYIARESGFPPAFVRLCLQAAREFEASCSVYADLPVYDIDRAAEHIAREARCPKRDALTVLYYDFRATAGAGGIGAVFREMFPTAESFVYE